MASQVALAAAARVVRRSRGSRVLLAEPLARLVVVAAVDQAAARRDVILHPGGLDARHVALRTPAGRSSRCSEGRLAAAAEAVPEVCRWSPPVCDEQPIGTVPQPPAGCRSLRPHDAVRLDAVNGQATSPPPGSWPRWSARLPRRGRPLRREVRGRCTLAGSSTTDRCRSIGRREGSHARSARAGPTGLRKCAAWSPPVCEEQPIGTAPAARRAAAPDDPAAAPHGSTPPPGTRCRRGPSPRRRSRPRRPRRRSRTWARPAAQSGPARTLPAGSAAAAASLAGAEEVDRPEVAARVARTTT